MIKNQNQNWQKHLDELEKHYHPDNFFVDQFKKPTNQVSSITDEFFSEPLCEDKPIEEEGQLSIDIYQDDDNLYVLTPVAGVKPENIEITLEKDALTIKGTREKSHEIEEKNSLFRECYWGKFSRSIILPVPVKQIGIKADFKNGVLKITLPKAEESKEVKIKVNHGTGPAQNSSKF